MKKRLIFITAILLLAGCLCLSACAEGESPIESIVVTTMPVTSYYRGDAFDFNNAAITVYRENGSVSTVALDSSMISDFDSQKIGEQILTVRYGAASAYLKVTVSNAPIEKITVVDGDYKKTYVQGQSLSVDGMFVAVLYTNGFSETLPVTEDMISNFDATQPGFRQLIVTYGGATALCEIEVEPKSIFSVGIEAPTKVNYVVGEKIDFVGAKLFVSYNNNTSEWIDVLKGGEYFDKDNFFVKINGELTDTFTTAGTIVYVTVGYKGFTTEFIVTVEAVKAKKIESVAPVKNQPRDNAGGVDLSDAAIKMTYNNGVEEIVSLTDERVTVDWQEFDITKNGTYGIKITCDGLSITQDVKVVEPVEKELIIDVGDRIYYRDGKDIDVTEWQCRIRMTNGNFKAFEGGATVSNVTVDMLADEYDFSTGTAGKRSYELRYYLSDGVEYISKVVEIEVAEKFVSEIKSFVAPSRKVYKTGETLALSDGSVTIRYNDGSEKTVTLTADMTENSVSDYTQTAGRNIRVTFVYTDAKYPGTVTFGYDIIVIKEVSSLSAETGEVKSNYVLGESFVSDGLAVYVKYADGTTDTFTDFSGAEWSFENTEYTATGRVVTRAYYGDLSHGYFAEIPVTVTNDVVSVNFFGGFSDFGQVTEGLAISIPTEAKLLVVRQNGDSETVNIVAAMLDYDRLDYTLGERTVKVKYDEKFTLDVKVTVIARRISVLTVKTEPAKTVYVAGETELDLTGLQVSVTYNNGTKYILNADNISYLSTDGEYTLYETTEAIARKLFVKISVLDTTLEDGKLNKKQVIKVIVTDTVTDESAECEFSVNCYKDVIKKISFGIEGETSYTVYAFEREDFVFPAGAFIKVEYLNVPDADTVRIADLSENDYTVEGYDKNVAGEQSVAINYLGLQCKFVVSVKEKIFKDLIVSPDTVTVKEGMNIPADAFTIKAHFVRNDGTEYSPVYEQAISLSNVTCSFDPTKVDFGDNDSVTQTHTIVYNGDESKAQTVMVTITRKKAVSVTMQSYPKVVYVENETALSYEGGTVMVEYDNGYSEVLRLDSNLIEINSQEFDPSEINGGSDRTATVYVTFEDKTGKKVQTTYEVTVKDRHNLVTDFGTTESNPKFSFEYGTGKDVRPDFSVIGYRTFNGSPVELINGSTFENGAGSLFSVYYLNENNVKFTEWPTAVGNYTMVIEFVGDAANNPYLNDSVKIDIVPKNIAVIAEDAEITFGESRSEFTFGWKASKYINNGGAESYPDGNPLVYGETQDEIVTIKFSIVDAAGRSYTFEKFSTAFVNAIPAGTYKLVPAIDQSLSNNYEVKSFVPATLTVAAKKIKIIAETHTKVYGERDMRFRYRAYEYNAATSGYDILIGGYYDGCDGAITLYKNGEESYVDSIASYTLQRSDASSENVGTYAILRGADGYIKNYEVAEYEGADFTITRKKVTLDATQAPDFRKYGENYEGEYARQEYLFSLSDGQELAFEETFGSIFAELIDYAKAFAENKITIEVYSAANPEDKITDFAPDQTCSAGNYIVKIKIISGIADNYETTVNDLSFTVLPMEASVSVKSGAVTYFDVADGAAAGEGYSECVALYEVGFNDRYNAEKAVAPVITFKKPSGNAVGKYEITLADRTFTENPNYNFTIKGDFAEYVEKTYVGTAYETLKDEVREEEANKAYLIVTPAEFTFDFAKSEVYARKSSIVPDVSFDFGGKSLPDVAKAELRNAITFGFTNKTLARSGLGYVTTDGYDGTVSYDYFANGVSRNFVTGSLSAENNLAVSRYVLFGIAEERREIYNDTFEYEVTPIVVEVNPLNESFDYTGKVYDKHGANAKGVAISAPTVCQGDVLSATYEVSVKYYGTDAFVKGEFVREAGDYKITITDLGNYNYIRSEASASYVCEFTINTVMLEVTLTGAVDYNGVYSVVGNYTGRADTRVMDNVWVEGGADGAYFSTQTQAIVNETTLTTPPNNLRIEPYYLDNGVEKTPVNAGTYDFRWSINAEYVNYSVRFVKKNAAGTYEDYEYKYVITPKQIDVLNMAEVNSKVYDGEAPAITNTAQLVIDGAVGSDKITGDDIKFTFVRDMDYVPENLRTLITADDLTSAGRYIMSASSDKTDNYYFKLDETYYYINRNYVEVTLNNKGSGYSLTKQYDTLAPSVELADLRVTTVSAIKDDVHIDLDVKYYKKNTSDSWSVYDASAKNPIGYYAYDFKPYFELPDGSKIAAESVDAGGNQLLSWNYYYTISNDSTDKNGCDGAFRILPKDIYLNMPDSDYSNFTINGITKRYYVHYRTYSAAVLSKEAASDEINLTDASKYYVCDANGVRIADETLTELGFSRENLAVNGSNASILNAGEYFSIDVGGISAANENFNVLNNDILFSIRKLDVEISLKLLTSFGNKPEKVYGESNATEKIFDFIDKAAFANAIGKSEEEININDWISFDEGDYDNNKIIIPLAARYGLADEDGTVHYFDSGEIIDAGAYKAYLNFYSAKNFNVTITGLDFTITPKEIVVNNAYRNYFDPSSVVIDYYIDGNVNKALEDAFVANILKKFGETSSVSNIASSVGGFADKGYYMSALKTEVNDVLAGYNNYTVVVNEVKPAAARDDHYYVALQINKVNLTVTVEAVGGGEITMKYGQTLTDADYRFVFRGFPVLSELQSDYNYSEENAKQRQAETQIKTSMVDVNKFVDTMKTYFATANISYGNLNSYVMENADLNSLENYNVILGEFGYSIAKRVLNLRLRSRTGTEYNTEGYISILAGEKDKLTYSEAGSGRLDYYFEITNPEEIIGYDPNGNLTIKGLLDLTWTGGSAPDNYASRVSYSITQNGSATLAAGKCKMKLTDTWYSSSNYIYSCEEMTVTYYPVVRNIGISGEGGELPYSAISLVGAESDYKNEIKNNLSMFVRVAYDGIISDGSDVYVDLKKGVDANYYSYIDHRATWSVQFVGDEPASVKIGDELKLKLVFTESFFGGEVISSVESGEFIVRVYGTEDETVKTKAESDFVYNVSGTDTASPFGDTKNINATYYLTDKGSTTAYSGNFDYIYSEFILGVKDSLVYTYETVLYENALTRVVLGFKGGSEFCYYVKIIEVSSGSVLSEATLDSYVVTKADGTESVRSILSDINVFDGRRHKLGVYLDKVGYLDYANKTVTKNSDVKTTTVTARNYRVAFTLDDRFSYQIDVKGGERTLIETVEEMTSGSGETYYEYVKSYSYDNYVDFSTPGKTGFVINECTAFIGGFTLKTMGIRMDNDGSVRDVRIWPVDNGSVIYVEKGGSLNSVEEIIYAKTINSVDGYAGNVTYSFVYTDAITGRLCSDITSKDAGLYRVTLSLAVMDREVYSVSFYVCIFDTTASTSVFEDYQNGTVYEISSDKPAVFDASEGIGVYSMDRQTAISYSKVVFDYANTDAMGNISFILKVSNSGISDVGKDSGLSLDFVKGSDGNYVASVKLSNGSTVWTKVIGTVNLVGIKNIIEARYDYASGVIIVRLLRNGEELLYAKIRRNFVDTPSIGESGVKEIIGAPGTTANGGYVGFYAYKGVVKIYEFLSSEARQNALSLMYLTAGDDTGTGTPADEAEISGQNVILADSYGMALATATKNTYLRFSAESGTGFSVMFANNTPYFTAYGADDGVISKDGEPTGERGAMLRVTQNGIYMFFYKYKMRWHTGNKVSNVNLLDGAEHTIVISITDEVITQNGSVEGSVIECYKILLTVDGTEIADGCFVPVNNNLNAFLTNTGRVNRDTETGNQYSSKVDSKFLPDSRYVGITIENSKLNIKELFVF